MCLKRDQSPFNFEKSSVTWPSRCSKKAASHDGNNNQEDKNGGYGDNNGDGDYNKSYDHSDDNDDHDNEDDDDDDNDNDIIFINLSFNFRTLSDNPIKTIEPEAFCFGVSSNTRV